MLDYTSATSPFTITFPAKPDGSPASYTFQANTNIDVNGEKVKMTVNSGEQYHVHLQNYCSPSGSSSYNSTTQYIYTGDQIDYRATIVNGWTTWTYVAPADTAPPVISGADDKTIHVGDSFDPKAGVTAKDDVDGDLTSQITIAGTVDTNTPGGYKLTYSVSDSAGNKATATRTITVTSPSTTIACAPQTGDPAASAWQWSALLAAMVCIDLSATVLRLRRRILL